MAKILLINGPNLNLLGSREPEIYGAATLEQIVSKISLQATELKHQFEHFQSNHEGAIIDQLHNAFTNNFDFILINPGAFTHTSIAIRDAFAGINIPFIELHLSNVHAREEFRQHSYLAPLAKGVITGFGTYSYSLALSAAHEYLQN